MRGVTVFANADEERAFTDTWCRRCFQSDETLKRIANKGTGCPLRQIAGGGAVPKKWTKRRNATLGNTYRCADFTKQPAVVHKGRAPELPQLELFNAPASTVRLLIPVAGWPDYHAEQTKTALEHQ
jgi:hypothetical protein